MMKQPIRLVIFMLLIVVLPIRVLASGGDLAYNGNDQGTDIMLQGFHWDSANQQGKWYGILGQMSEEISKYFSVVWMPPPNNTPSFAKQGYMPTEWYDLNNYYGNQADLMKTITALHNNKLKVLADIVINHRCGTNQCPHGCWILYQNPAMSPGVNLIDGKYDLINSGEENTCKICANNQHSEGTWSYGWRTYTCDDYNAAPDLSHWEADTRQKVKNWLSWLKNSKNAGFDGWRYDYVRGFAPQFLAEYNDETNPYLSVGEFFKFENDPPQGLPSSQRQASADLINASNNKTMLFDYDLKRTLNQAFGNNVFSGNALAKLGENGVNGLVGWWSQAAVTFVDNHDTGWSPGESLSHWPLPCPCNGDLISVKAAYAMILTHPGVPCVYWADWSDRDADLKTVIETLIKIRKANHVLRGSRVWVERAENGLYAAYIGNENGEEVAIKIGNQGWENYESWQPTGALGLMNAFERHYMGGHAFTVYYKNKI